MEIRLLGPVELVAVDGRPGRLSGPKERALLALLAVNAGQVVSDVGMLDAVWADEPPRTARRTLQAYLSRLRRALADAGLPPGAALESRPGGWQLILPPGVTDVDRAEKLVATARSAAARGDNLAAALDLSDALRLWRGRALEEFAGAEWARPQVTRLEALRLAAVDEKAEAELACGRHVELVEELGVMCREEPLREPTRALLMLALYRSGRSAEALRVCQDLRAALRAEIGADPGPELAALESRILVQDPGLDWRPAPAPAGRPTEPAVPRSLDPSAATTFVGRHRELETILSRWETARSGSCQVVLLAGEPGIGKTTLLGQVARGLADRGAVVLYGRSDEENLVAFQPFVEALDQHVARVRTDWLRADLGPQAADLALLLPGLARRLPELADAAGGTGAESDRYRIYEAVSRLLGEMARRSPVVLVLDDLHWAGRPTLGLLLHVLRRSRGAPLLVLGAYRDTDLVRTQPLAETLIELRNGELMTRIHLGGLGEDDVVALVTGAAEPSGADRQLAAALWSETEGNPLFLREILRHLEETGVVCREGDGRLRARRRIDQLGIPEGVREVIGRRLSRLSEPANAVLRAGSVLGREMRVDVLERLTDLDEEQVLIALEEAVEAGLAEESPGPLGRFAFTHALVRNTLYEELSLSRRVRMHQRAGEALEALLPEDGPHLPELAFHFAQAAVTGGAERAMDHLCRAGEWALRQAAFEEAARHFATAVEVAEDAELGPAVRADLLLRQGDAEMRTGDIAVARVSFERVVDLVGADDPERLARAALGYAAAGVRPIWVEMFIVNERSVELLETALDQLPVADSSLRARVMAALAQELYFDARTQARREELSAEALAMARRIGDARSLAQVLSGRVLAILGPDHAAEVAELGTELLAKAEELEDRPMQAVALRFRSMYSPEPGGTAADDLRRWQLMIDELKDPASLLLDQFARAWFTTLEGDFAAAETAVLEGFARGQEIRDRNAIGGAVMSMAMLRLYQGRVGELVNAAVAGKDVYPVGSAWADCMLAACYSELGMLEEAHDIAARLDPTDAVQMPRNAMWMVALGMLARAHYRLGDVEGARVVYERLVPFADFWGLGSSIGTGSLHLPLAWCALTMGEHERAELHFMAALERNRESGWTAAAVETDLHYGRFLATRDDGRRDVGRAAEILGRVEKEASRLGMAAMAREARELCEALADPSGAGREPSSRSRFVSRRDRARSKLTRTGRAAIARWTRDATDEDLVRRFGSNLTQRALFSALVRSFQPAMAYGFDGDIVLELRPPDDSLDPAAADWWTIEVRAGGASARRGRSEAPALTLHSGLAQFVRMASGEVHPVRALVENQIEIEGDVMLAARIPDMFGVVEPVEELAAAARG